MKKVLQSGLTEGEVKGRAEGRAEGEAKSRTEIAKKMKEQDLSVELIVETTGLSKEEIEAL